MSKIERAGPPARRKGRIMLVLIALTKEKERELGARISDCVHRAVASALDLGEEGCFRIVTEQAPGLRAATVQAHAEQTNAAAVVLIYPVAQISDRKKRILYGRIGEGLEKEGLIERSDLVVGVIEQPYRNWYYGGAAMKLEQMMASGLV
jgi:hypothetical protein